MYNSGSEVPSIALAHAETFQIIMDMLWRNEPLLYAGIAGAYVPNSDIVPATRIACICLGCLSVTKLQHAKEGLPYVQGHCHNCPSDSLYSYKRLEAARIISRLQPVAFHDYALDNAYRTFEVRECLDNTT